MTINNKFLLLSILIACTFSSRAQSDGPRSHLPSPTGVWAVNFKYMNLNQNLLTSGNILLKNADINVDVFPVTFIHTFALGKTWARVYAMAAPVTSFTGTIDQPQLPVNRIYTSGFSDGWISFEVALKGNAAMNIIDFTKKGPPKVEINGLFRLWYPGTYDKDKFVNLGSNRWAFDFGVPMQFMLNNDVKKGLWLETWPGVQFYTVNNEPAKPSNASEITQRPLFYWENHLSYNFTRKLYAGIDLRVQQGGQTSHDEVEDDNRISILGGGVFAGYKILPFMDFYANYAGIITGDNGARSEMIRLSLVVSYINMKKYKP